MKTHTEGKLFTLESELNLTLNEIKKRIKSTFVVIQGQKKTFDITINCIAYQK